ncbi:MAG TPA: hypothetical protein VE010_24485 [Thermoanaerobaculia bacterium]|nr:hypothetical protein [Thermoanaerobaculia bacterium]
MKLRQRPLGLLVLVTAVLLSLTGATSSINPLVTRRAQPAGPAPAECAEALAPAPLPRVDVPNIPLPQVVPAEAPAPPSGSLRAALQSAQTALTRNDRPEFDASLEAARDLLRTYPTGAERRSGEELVRIYEASARLWDAQYQSPFFDQASPEYDSVKNVPGYEEAVRRSVLVDPTGRRYYPAAESRDFLARVAADRLRGIGIQSPAPRVTRNERPGVPDVDTPRTQPSIATGTGGSPSNTTPSISTSPSRPRTTTPSTTVTARPRRTPTTTTARATRPPRSSAPSRPRITESRPQTGGAATPAPVAAAPQTSTPSAANSPAAPSPAAPATGAAGEDLPDEPDTPDTATAGVDTPATDTPGTDTTAINEPTATAGTDTGNATATDAPAEPEAATQSRTRSVVLPTILILIGLGVLIVLFRASK